MSFPEPHVSLLSKGIVLELRILTIWIEKMEPYQLILVKLVNFKPIRFQNTWV